MLSARIKTFLTRLMVGAVLSASAIALLAYVVDYAVFRHRLANNQAFLQVTVTSYDAVQQKNGKTQFLFNPPQPQTCVNTLFPHQGFTPCWYLQRHSEQRTDI